MLKKAVTFTNHNDEKQTKVLYFHLNKFEWLELETFTKGGLIENLKNALEDGNAKKTIDILRKIILTAYGEKNEEGAFEKSDDLAIKFSKTEAFSELFYELAYNAEASQEFFMGLIPKDLQGDAAKAMMKQPLAKVDAINDVAIQSVAVDNAE